MEYLITNKNWKINKDYNKEKLLYLLVDRYDYYDSTSLLPSAIEWHNKLEQNHRYYNFPAGHYEGHLFWAINDEVIKTLGPD